jgi:hypothetical protein
MTTDAFCISWPVQASCATAVFPVPVRPLPVNMAACVVPMATTFPAGVRPITQVLCAYLHKFSEA